MKTSHSNPKSAQAVAAATPLPNLLYDIPVRTGRKISTELIVRLAHEVPNIVGVKDAAGNPCATARVAAATPGSFEVYSGDDAMTLPLLAVGAAGVVGVATHWTAPDHVEMFDHWEAGDPAAAPAPGATIVRSVVVPGGRPRDRASAELARMRASLLASLGVDGH